jgi:hypothetical protein
MSRLRAAVASILLKQGRPANSELLKIVLSLMNQRKQHKTLQHLQTRPVAM